MLILPIAVKPDTGGVPIDQLLEIKLLVQITIVENSHTPGGCGIQNQNIHFGLIPGCE
ncbi:hypothetical protein D3C76_1645860 [compost metagenome]